MLLCQLSRSIRDLLQLIRGHLQPGIFEVVYISRFPGLMPCKPWDSCSGMPTLAVDTSSCKVPY